MVSSQGLCKRTLCPSLLVGLSICSGEAPILEENRSEKLVICIFLLKANRKLVRSSLSNKLWCSDPQADPGLSREQPYRAAHRVPAKPWSWQHHLQGLYPSHCALSRSWQSWADISVLLLSLVPLQHCPAKWVSTCRIHSPAQVILTSGSVWCLCLTTGTLSHSPLLFNLLK